MNQTKLYDIAEVCKMLGTTSRTLRFYEEKGIITSTTEGISPRRRYTEAQISQIRNVLVLRTLGLSIKSITELQAEQSDLKDAVLFRRAEIFAAIERRACEIRRLNEALSALNEGKDIFCETQQRPSAPNTEEAQIAQRCAEAIRMGNTKLLYDHLSPNLTEKMSKEMYEQARWDTLSPIGEFVCFDRLTVDEESSNRIYCFLKFSKLGLKISFVFRRKKIEGLWLGYYDMNEKDMK